MSRSTDNPLGERPPVDGDAAPLRKRLFMRLLNVYPPYLGAGVKLHYMAPDLSCFDVKMVMRPWNKNYVGTHFGGSLYSMCDPFFMLILFEQMGKDHIVWDKAARIRFRRPGKGTMWARFHLDSAEVETLRRRAAEEETVEPVYTARVLDSEGRLVAEVEKTLYVRKKQKG